MPYVGALADVPAGWFLCDGTNGTPDLRDRFLEGSATPNLFIEPGLPNIVATFFTIQLPTTGAIHWKYRGYFFEEHAQSEIANFEFNASWCSSIYRDDIATVQPAAYTVYYIIRLK